MRSDLDSLENQESSQGHAVDQRHLGPLWQHGLQGGASISAPQAPGRKYGARSSPLSEYMSLNKQTVGPFWE